MCGLLMMMEFASLNNLVEDMVSEADRVNISINCIRIAAPGMGAAIVFMNLCSLLFFDQFDRFTGFSFQQIEPPAPWFCVQR